MAYLPTSVSAVRLLLCTLAAALVLAPAARAGTPPVKHVFIIVLENKNFEDSFGANAKGPYLARSVRPRGQLLTQYYGTAHFSLGNYIAMVSGQAPNPQTQGDCAFGFNNVEPGVIGPDDQAVGMGCVYPAEVKTIADQLEGAGKTWKGYMEDMANTPSAPKTCRHPAIGANDDTQSARPGDQYATRHNPFVYFHSIIDDQARCDAHVVPLEQLTPDLRSVATTPNYVFITPDLCHDGHDEQCADGGKGGYEAIDEFLRSWVPDILASPAYADGGMLIVTFDESESGAEACCNEPTGPNTPAPGIQGPGGGRTGAVVISPYTTPGSANDTPYNHYSLLRSLEDLFGLAHLGYAAAPDLKPFGADVFNASGTPPTPGAGNPPSGKKPKKKATRPCKRRAHSHGKHKHKHGCHKKKKKKRSQRR
jgi:phosphatidylinositol-3-phosphatase